MCLAVPLKVTRVKAGGVQGQVAVGDSTLDVDFSLVDDVREGDYVLVHAGMAIEKLDEQAARETLALLAEYEESFRDGANNPA